MSRKISENHTFTKSEIEYMLKYHARGKIIGSCYEGEFGEQSLTWNTDGSATVITEHTPKQ